MGFNVATYSPYDLNGTLDGLSIDGFLEGTMITVKYKSKLNNTLGGAQGDTTVVAILDKRGEADFFLKQSSRMHAILTGYSQIQRNGGKLPLMAFVLNLGSKPIGFGTAVIEDITERSFSGTTSGSEEPKCHWKLSMPTWNQVG